MEDSPVAGPSRPQRSLGPNGRSRDSSQRRKNELSSPARPRRAQAQVDAEYSRGTDRPTGRTLFDPSHPLPLVQISPPPMASSPLPLSVPSPKRPTRTSETETRRRRPVSSTTRNEPAIKQLFNPDIHDPHQFQRVQSQPTLLAAPEILPGPTAKSSSRQSAGSSVRSAEEEAGKARERRKRREGSERGSAQLNDKKRDTDSRSKGSRSSEGSESFKDRDRGKGKTDGVKAVLKDIHNRIRALEVELTELHRKMDVDASPGFASYPDRPRDPFAVIESSQSEDLTPWIDLIGKHWQLAELHREFLERVFDPLVPSSFQQLAVKYNIPSRLWQSSFFMIFEKLRHAWMTAFPAALDLLTDVVYDAYKFYTDLLEDQLLASFRTAWIEALGDLARYRMTIASHVNESSRSRQADHPTQLIADGEGAPSSSGHSVGAEVAQSWVVEDKETWRTTARDWYTLGITEKPGEGRLHHHLALLCRDIRGQEGRALHHFTKSLIVTHQYTPSRESLLPLFATHLQSQRSMPEATAMDLFVRLHGMLFTKIEMDDFDSVKARFMERLEEDARLDGVSRKTTVTQVDWIIMASVNIAALLEYGSSTGVLRKAFAVKGQERRRAQMSADDGEGEEDVDTNEVDGVSLEVSTEDETQAAPAASCEPELNPTFTHAWELMCSMLNFTLTQPTRQQGMYSVLNPYISLSLTFLSTLLREPAVLAVLADLNPWIGSSIVDFLNDNHLEIIREPRLVSGAPLPEDWAVRGMEWVGRRVYERGFWKPKVAARNSTMTQQGQAPRSGDRLQSEMDVLLANFEGALDISEGVVDDVDGSDLTDGPVAVNQRRWQRVAWATGTGLKYMDDLVVEDGKFAIVGDLKRRMVEMDERLKVEKSREDNANKAKREKERLEEAVKVRGYESADEEEDKDRVQVPSAPTMSRKNKAKASLNIVPGYTMLVFDTNVLVSSLPLFERSVEGGQWSVIVPLPVVTELDGLSKNPPPLGLSATAAISYLESRIRTHALCLKIQTSRGNYLSDLLIRTEHVDFSDPTVTSRNMDDLILGVASFQVEHFTDRSALLGMPPAVPGATKVLLVTSDRNLRLHARAKGISAADEKELQAVLDGV